jgi:homoserine kinase
VGADLPLETETLRVLPVWLCLMRLKQILVLISKSKNIKAGSGIGSSAASAAGAVYGINALLGTPFETKDLVQFARRKKLACNAHADNVAPCFGWIYFGEATAR